jgi:hypothetical protein
MTRPGARIRALCVRWCSERTRRRLVDPALADLQAEYAAAQRTGSRLRTLSTLLVGYVALVKVLLLAGVGDVGVALRTWRPEEATGLRSGARMALGLVVVSTVLLTAPLLHSLGWILERLDWTARSLAALYLIPSSLAITAPYSLGVAVAWALYGAARTRKLAGIALVVAALASAATFANLLWVVPDANQGFRQQVSAVLYPEGGAPLARGINELSPEDAQHRWREVHGRGDAREIGTFETWYYRRFAISLSPLVVVSLIVAIAFWRPWTRRGLTSVALAVCVVNYALLMSAQWLATLGVLPPLVLAWSGDALCLLAAITLASASRWGRASATPAPTR